jgi:hypothetical protein
MKVHLIDSEEPLQEGSDLVPFCQLGKTNPRPVKKAAFAFMVDGDITSEDLSNIGNCRNCREMEIEKRYVYGIYAGQEE